MNFTQMFNIKNMIEKTKDHSQIKQIKNNELKTNFLKPTYCPHCSTFISEFEKQAYKCQNCRFTCRTDCANLDSHNCLSENKNSCIGTHSLRRSSKMFSICNHCGKYICGIFRKGYKCSNEKCKLHLHSSCLAYKECEDLSNSKYGVLLLNLISFSNGNSITVQIDVIEARNLISSKKTGFPHPYCKFVLKCNSRVHETFTTDPQQNTLNPQFDDSITFTVENDSNTELHIIMYSKLGKKAKLFLGGLMLTLEDIKRYSTGSNIPFSLLKPKLANSSHHVATPIQTELPRDKEGEDTSSSHSLTLEDFSVISQIGEGGFGTVYLANLKHSQERAFAIKVFNKQRIRDQELDHSLLVEHRVGMLANRPSFLAGILSSFQDDENYYLVFDFFGGGDLLFHICNERVFLENRTRFYVAEISIALFFLHKQGIAYLDLKLENILLDNDGHIKLVDFGFCAEGIYNGRSQGHSYCGTLGYIAPEILAGKTHDCGADLWSLGVLTYEMLLGRFPFTTESQSREELLDVILKQPPRIPKYLSVGARHLLSSLLKLTPQDRLGYDFENGYENFRNAPFFSEIDWVKLENRELTPPFVPKIQSVTATTYFDTTNASLKVSNSSNSHSRASSELSQVFNYTSPEITSLL